MTHPTMFGEDRSSFDIANPRVRSATVNCDDFEASEWPLFVCCLFVVSLFLFVIWLIDFSFICLLLFVTMKPAEIKR